MLTISLGLLVSAGLVISQTQPDLAELMQRTKSDDQQIRVLALEELASLGSLAAPVAKELCELLSARAVREDPFTMSAAITAIGEIGNGAKVCIPALQGAARDRRVDSASQGAALISISKIRLQDSNPDVRIRAAELLGRSSPSAVPALRKALKDPDPRVRDAAARSIRLLESLPKPAAVLSQAQSKRALQPDADAASSEDLPDSWRRPAVKELAGPVREKSSVAFAKATADFNGDGVLDEAVLLKSTRFSGEGLWIRLSNAQDKFEWVKLDETAWGKEYPDADLGMSIDVMPPGIYAYGCFDDAKDCNFGPDKDRPKLRSRDPNLMYFKMESADPYSSGAGSTTSSCAYGSAIDRQHHIAPDARNTHQ